MSVRKLKNRSGSQYDQVIRKLHERYKVIKTLGSATTQQEIDNLVNIARQEIERLSSQSKLFVSQGDVAIEQASTILNNANIHTLISEIIFGRIYDYIGFDSISEELFRHLVIAHLAFPLSKLKTIY